MSFWLPSSQPSNFADVAVAARLDWQLRACTSAASPLASPSSQALARSSFRRRSCRDVPVVVTMSRVVTTSPLELLLPASVALPGPSSPPHASTSASAPARVRSCALHLHGGAFFSAAGRRR
jgi:hypothetical protein